MNKKIAFLVISIIFGNAFAFAKQKPVLGTCIDIRNLPGELGRKHIRFYGESSITSANVLETIYDGVPPLEFSLKILDTQYVPESRSFVGQDFKMQMSSKENQLYYGVLNFSTDTTEIQSLPMACSFKNEQVSPGLTVSNPKLVGVLAALLEQLDDSHSVEAIVVVEPEALKANPKIVETLVSDLTNTPSITILDTVGKYILVQLTGTKSVSPFLDFLLRYDEVKYASSN